jgi:predicted permease
MRRDLLHAVRMLFKSKGWTAVVLVSLALGIGANTALFTAVNGIFVQNVAVPHPDTLVRLKWAGKNDMVRSSSDYGNSLPDAGRDVRSTVSFAVVEALRAANQTLTEIAACAPTGSFNVVVNGQAETASAFEASGNYFRVLQVPAALGRTFGDDDDKPGAPPVAVISDAYWRRRFGSDPKVIERTVMINNQQVAIIGVTRPEFTGVQRLGTLAHDVTVPIALDPVLQLGSTRLTQPTSWWLQMIGRLKPGVTPAHVRGNLEGVFQQTARAGMDSYMSSLSAEQKALSTNRQRGSAVPQLLVGSAARGIYDIDRSSTQSAMFLGVVVIIVLLIVCANVANLLLSRATTRRRELSIRLSMGATRGRLIRQLLTESLLLSGLGGGLGVLVGFWSRQLLPFGQSSPIDWRVFAFVAGLSVLTGAVFGLLPALRATRVDLAEAMKEQGRSVVATRSRLSKILLVLQVAMSLVLVIGAGLFLRSLQNLRSVDVGFNPTNLLMFSIDPRLNRYDPPRMAELYDQLQSALRALPGVRSVGLTRTMLLSGSTSQTSMFIQGHSEENSIHVMLVTPEFFDTMEIPVLRGRAFTRLDTRTSPKVAIINEIAARTLFKDVDPIGQRVGGSLEQSGEVEIIGVIRDTKYASVRAAAPPTWYQPALQFPARPMAFVVRTAGDPSAMTEPVRTAVRNVDPNLPLMTVTTQMEQVEGRFAQERLFAMAYSLFAGLALVLACIGLFGLMSYSVARRTNEIGIRMALGARRFDVARMVMRESLILVVIGIAIGLGSALAAGKYVASVLFGLAPTDAATMVAAAGLIVIVAAVAGYLPARRASRVDPLVALHRD